MKVCSVSKSQALIPMNINDILAAAALLILWAVLLIGLSILGF